MKPTPPKPSRTEKWIAIEPESFVCAKNINELRAIFPQAKDYLIAEMLIYLRAFPDGMEIARKLHDTDHDSAFHVIKGRAWSLVYDQVSQTTFS